MAGKQLEAELKISGELDKSLKEAIKNAEQNMDKFAAAADKAEGATAALDKMIKQQSKTLQSAQKMYSSYVLSGNEASDEAQQLAAGIAELTADLNRNKTALANAESAAKQLADGLDDAGGSASSASGKLRETGNAARQSGDGFTIAKGAIADLVSSGFQALISGASQAVDSLFSLSEQTREFRQDMATLETAFGQANFSAETATSTWKDLYAVFGEDDRAVETANNIARMAENQQDLDNWVKITQGTWATYQDALPVENLAEAAGETAKTGTVTGGLADALNWSTEAAEMFSKYMGKDVVTAEDAFNVALSKCSDEQERQQLITDTLMKLYGDAAGQYEDTAGSLMDANKAAADAQLAQANLGEIIEPVTTAWTVMKTNLMNAVAPALEVVSGKLMEAMGWLQEHPRVLQAVSVALGALAAAITVIITVVTIYTAVQMAANAAMLPVIAIIVAIVAAVTAAIYIGYLLVTNWETIKAKAGEVWQTVKNAWDQMLANVSEDVQAIVNTVQTWWGNLVNIVKTLMQNILDTVKNIWNTLKSFVSDTVSSIVNTVQSKWSSLTSILTAPFNTVKNVISSVSSAVGGLMSKVKGVGSKVSSALGFSTYAAGGFTDGISIAGEAGTEAVISFDPRYRADNLRYWAQAGRMLGADVTDYTLSGSGGGSTTNSTVIGDVTFSPNIVVNGDAKKQDIVDAIRQTYPEFMDLIEEVLADREVGVYA